MTATNAFSVDELAEMQVAQVAHYNDTCQVGTYSETQDSFGYPSPGWTYGAVIECGFNPKGGWERASADKTVLKSDASVRLPIGTVIGPKDMVKIISRFGSTLSPSETFQVLSLPMRGPSGLLVDLVRLDL